MYSRGVREAFFSAKRAAPFEWLVYSYSRKNVWYWYTRGLTHVVGRLGEVTVNVSPRFTRSRDNQSINSESIHPHGTTASSPDETLEPAPDVTPVWRDVPPNL